MIASGVKKEEYREIKPYWIKRLTKCRGDNRFERTGFFCKKANCQRCLMVNGGLHPFLYTHIRFRRAYTSTTMLVELKDISIGIGNSEWGAPDIPVFILRFEGVEFELIK